MSKNPDAWWVQTYVGYGEHEYRIDNEADVEVAGPIEGLQYIAALFGDWFLRDNWLTIASDGDLIAWYTDILGVTLVQNREVDFDSGRG
jgi:hypothetical protein